MKRYELFSIVILFVVLCFTGCQNDTETFDNKIYIDNNKVGTILLKKDMESLERVIQASVPKPAETDFMITYEIAPSLVNVYNSTYYNHATMLPEECYEIGDGQVRIPKGSTKSTELTVRFKNLSVLDRELMYVLPVTIADADIAILESARTCYYVFKGAALINTVANINENNIYVSWKNPSVVSRLYKLTAEALVRADKLDNKISTLMGIEGKFLIRLGDSEPSNQIQIATEMDNVTSADWILPIKTWVHVAVTYNYATGLVEMYIDGKKKTEQTLEFRSFVNWGVAHSDESDGKPRCFWIGYSYDKERYFNGDICECRIWNRILSEEEINVKDHFYYVDSNSEGLVAYWKFDDADSNTIKDHTTNGNDATASYTLVWKPVELPQK
ncbi:DUF1735 and LamG domain-containing protein [uncultured Bacteroides sp.]|uniref:DUF1735 and LamG domain-containing protein n=1 Tax=uncultured Bacteroides sp. TaxID=162156 RepID=UPI002674D3FA|nr:DUF1735 and LamG domain-containing protein [uncultured Bacteroides sp.]